MTMETKYVKALRFEWLTKFYDPLIEWSAREATVKRQLLRQANIKPGYRVLDLGCGTGTLALMAKRSQPDSRVIGLDGDPHILELAKGKVERSGLEVIFDLGMAYELPYEDESFELALSSLLFHHLSRRNKRRSVEEVRRVLRPGGEFHIADWGQAHNVVQRALFGMVQLLDGFNTTDDAVKGRLPALLTASGFEQAEETARYMTVFGVFSLYRAIRRATSS